MGDFEKTIADLKKKKRMIHEWY